MRTQVSMAAMAEWLRRWTRNPMGSSRVGSNPTRSASFFFLIPLLKGKDDKIVLIFIFRRNESFFRFEIIQ